MESLEKDEIIKNKVKFIVENKDMIIENFGIISYPLFIVLTSDEDLSNIPEYKQLVTNLQNKTGLNNNYCYRGRDEKYIFDEILHFLDRIGVDLDEKAQIHSKLYRYVRYLPEESEELGYVKRIKRSA